MIIYDIPVRVLCSLSLSWMVVSVHVSGKGEVFALMCGTEPKVIQVAINRLCIVV
jgi:hypothetical protein